MISVESNQLQSQPDTLREQKIMTILNFLTLKNLAFPKILNFLSFSEQKATFTIKKSESLLKNLLKQYDFELIAQFTHNMEELSESELIVRMLNQIHTLDQSLKYNNFLTFYYKICDFSQKNNTYIHVCERLQYLIQGMPQIQQITFDYQYFVRFKAQLLAIGMAIQLKIPLTSILLFTHFYHNKHSQQFYIEFGISNLIFKEIYSLRKFSNFNFMICIDQLLHGDLNLSTMYNFVEKIFPQYEYVLNYSNFDIFQKNLELLDEQKQNYIIQLKYLMVQKEFQNLQKVLSNYSFIVDEADVFCKLLDGITQYCNKQPSPVFDFVPVNVPSFIKKHFFRDHEHIKLTQQQQVESLLIINKILTEMVYHKFPYAPLLAYLDLSDPNSQSLLKINKEFVIECQHNKVFNLFLAKVHYNFQTLAKSQTYSKAFYQQQLAKQELEQKEIIIQMLQILIDKLPIIQAEIISIIEDEEIRLNIWSYITTPKEYISEYNTHYTKISHLLRELQANSKKQLQVDPMLTEQIKNKIKEIQYQATKQPYQERRLGRPPGFYQNKQQKNIEDDVIIVEKKPKLNLMREFESFLF